MTSPGGMGLSACASLCSPQKQIVLSVKGASEARGAPGISVFNHPLQVSFLQEMLDVVPCSAHTGNRQTFGQISGGHTMSIRADELQACRSHALASRVVYVPGLPLCWMTLFAGIS